jgi:hypothetical protein
MLYHHEPNPNLLYLVAVFAIEPAAETYSLSGSLGRVKGDRDLDWHVAVVQVGRRQGRLSRGVALAVVYMRIDRREYPNVVAESDVTAAFELLETLVAPKEWDADRPVSIRLIQATNYTGDGHAQGGIVNPFIVSGVAHGTLGRDQIDWALLEQHPELRLAIRFYTRGRAAADERFLADACINYARCLECLVGSSKPNTGTQRKECERLGLDFADVHKFLDKTRGRYAIAHALDRVERGKPRRLKKLPTKQIEIDARKLARSAIESFIDKLEPLDRDLELRKGIRYSGLPPVNTNLPLPLEAVWGKPLAWEYTAPGLSLDTTTTSAAAHQCGISPQRVRHLAKRHLVRAIKERHRWKVSLTSVQLCLALAAETAMDYRGSIFMRIGPAAQEAGMDPVQLRTLIREKRIRGRLAGGQRSGLPREVVDVASLCYFLWKQRRETITRQLSLPRPWQKRQVGKTSSPGPHERGNHAHTPDT